jgi:DNA-binding transcriptional ArsR family regulator
MTIDKVVRALANRRRLAIVKLLNQGSLTVMEVALAIKLSIHSTSKHLQILAKADIVDYSQVGLNRHYRLMEPRHPLVITALPLL